MLNTPILLIIFNRPDTTSQVIGAIRRVRPRQLFVAADGPRDGVESDRASCAAARAVATAVDWDCDLQTLFRESNVGCGLGPSSAISWFFESVEAGIVLEDDCVPDPTFFSFCQELLDFYKDVPKVMQVSGANYLRGTTRGKASYYFSRYPHSVGGWATWRRSWQLFDYEAISEDLRKHIWDWQWSIAFKLSRGLAAVPNRNLITNIGCGRADATHTIGIDLRCANLPSYPMEFPLTHPRRIKKMDRYTDYTPLKPEERTYRGAPARFVRIGYRYCYNYCRSRAASFVKRVFFGKRLARR